ncbi:carboxylic acid reductase [Mycolicibacterium fluoranthenivorans]|uniref:Carboxylic acid reductase n=1 Tax=Mycolicibacterium fluoranthenivorans TaxID=258505 RepID=A0A1G4WIS5_9MYCO|nr:carboxylic acid reductase [Mycolicibacterium fluoranthenivorans]SCX23786.1 fatty acid CoA ligase FadD9 [Mycolicibacterium fluoranthenivorans]
MSTATQDERLERRVADLIANDPQFAAARPDATVAEAAEAPGIRLPQIVQTVLQGYADRPALGQRAVEFVTDPATGRTTAALLPRFETVTYGELWNRVRSAAAALYDAGVAAGDRVAILGFTSADYTVIDTALGQIGAVSVPLQSSSSASALAPILAETEPRVIAASIGYVDEAVELALTGHAPERVLVFDYHPEVDDHREALAAAVEALSAAAVVVETLSEVLARGSELAQAPAPSGADPNPLSLLIYTSGSTGAPKGAMYLESQVASFWQRSSESWFGPSVASINLNFMPMSHVMGRGILYSTLAAGGTCYFAARADLSTLLEDLALARPTELNFVPRVWEMLYQEFQSRSAHGTDEDAVLADMRDNLLGGRYVDAMTGSAPITDALKSWVESFLGIHLREGYGSTEAGMVFFDGRVQRPPTIDYKLVDVPDLGYYHTDQPYPRGELLVKTVNLFPGYYKRPEVTAGVFDEDGFYRTGDIVAELGPDQIRYVDRRNNVLKLAQGEFVTLAKLEAAFSNNSPLVRQIYVYGNSAQPYLLAVVVPTEDAQARWSHDELKRNIAASFQDVAKALELQSYEVPRDFLVETTPFTVENGLLTGIRKLAWPKLKAHYGPALEELYAELADGQARELRELRSAGADAPVIETVVRAAAALLGAATSDVAPDAHFTDLGGDSLSALTFGNLLQEIFGVEVPVSVIVSPASDLATIAAHIETQRAGGTGRPTFSSVHGRHAAEVTASELTLDKFLDSATLAAAPSLPKAGSEIRTVLLTGATGFLGRYLALEWLERMDLVDGKLICLVRARSNEEARARLDKTFDSGDPKLLAHYRELAADHLEVIAGDKGEADLGLDKATWQRLADTVDFIVDPAALVNHVLPYSELFGPNALGTAELIRIALTTKIKPFAYVSTIGVGDQIEPGTFVEDADVRTMSATRAINDSYANGYGTSKWAGEVLLREAHDLAGLPVSVFRCDMILADTTYAGQLNLPDMFTRMMFSLVATGIAPGSFYQLDAEGKRQASHYDGLPVEFIAEAISTLGAHVQDGFATYHVMNPYDDGIGMDTFVDWLVEAGYKIERVDDYAEWLSRFETTQRGLPDRQRQASLLPLLHNYQHPETPLNGSIAPTEVFRAAVQDAKIGPDKDIPHVSPAVIVKYITDLQLLGLI